MSQQLNLENAAGKSTREMAQKRRERRKNTGLKTAALIFATTAILVAYLCFGHPAIITTVVLVILFWILTTKIDRIVLPEMDNLFKREGHALQGAQAEEEIGKLLNSLGVAAYQVLHDLRTDRGNIDHLVFRKDGAIFLIETKSHHGRVRQKDGQLLLNGKFPEKDFIGQSLENIFWVRNFLKMKFEIEPWIHSVIVFTNAGVERHLMLKNISIIEVSYLKKWMSRQHGNPKVAKLLWPEIESLKNELRSTVSNQLAPLPALH
ncbi:MAG TPA: nuclease-related domain-containing protein [Verrucomicrobiae bacterium]|nr:nuclease-related domain-containing protein [Verrucomicrobiae bacterium]